MFKEYFGVVWILIDLISKLQVAVGQPPSHPVVINAYYILGTSYSTSSIVEDKMEGHQNYI